MPRRLPPMPWFSNSKKDEKQEMESKSTQRRRKLDRRNAMKNIDYEASATSSSYSSGDSSSLRTRSLDIHPYSDRSSFRIGGIDGEIDEIFLRIGISGPEDLAIPTAAWEATKVRSSSDIQYRSRLNWMDSSNDSDKLEEKVDRGFLSSLGPEVRISDEQVNENSTLVESSNCQNSLLVGSSGGGGIKGVRPPVLAPPPSMYVPVLDDIGSNWDMLRAFGPEDNNRGSSSKVRLDTSFYDEAEEISGSIVVREEAEGVRLGETAVLSESCSFSTSNDDDSSSSNTDPMYIISPNGRFKREIKSWTRGSLLGSGSFGTVYEGLSDDGFFFAVKEVSLLDQGSQGKQSIHQLEQEIALLSRFEHENIVQYYGTDKNEEKLYIFLEYVTKGSLAQLYGMYNLQDSQVSAYTRQILFGLKYLHDQDVVHRDIKCANILVDANGSVKLADFGLAKATRFNDVKSCKGTAFWMAPEVVNRRNQGYGLPADIWSLGCTVLEMLTRRLPYPHLEWMQALFKIGSGELPPVPNSLSRDARDFILKCLKVNPGARPTAAQLLEHPFVKRPLPDSLGSASPMHNNWRRS